MLNFDGTTNEIEMLLRGDQPPLQRMTEGEEAAVHNLCNQIIDSQGVDAFDDLVYQMTLACEDDLRVQADAGDAAARYALDGLDEQRRERAGRERGFQ